MRLRHTGCDEPRALCARQVHHGIGLRGKATERRALQMEMELLVRKLLGLASRPAVITLQLPHTGRHWLRLLRNESAAAKAALAVHDLIGAPISSHYSTAHTSVPAALVAAARQGTPGGRLEGIHCLGHAYSADVTHPGQCIHDLAAEMLLAELQRGAELAAGPAPPLTFTPSSAAGSNAASPATASAIGGDAPARPLPPPLYLGACNDTLSAHRAATRSEGTSRKGAVRNNDVADVCARLRPASSSLLFHSPSSVRRQPPLTATSCVRWPPPPTARGGAEEKLGGAKTAPSVACVAHDREGGWWAAPPASARVPTSPTAALAVLMDAQLECGGRGSADGASCLPSRGQYWVATHDDERQQFGWLTCGLPGARPLRYAMNCSGQGTLYVSWLRSYTRQWGVVDVDVQAEHSDSVLAHATIDSRDATKQHTFVETTALPLSGLQPAYEHVKVSLTPKPRASAAVKDALAEAAPAMSRELDRRCPSKFKLIALACY